MKTIITWVLVIAVIIGGALIIKHNPAPATPTTTTTSTSTPAALHTEVTYFCTEGSFAALYTDKNLLLTFKDKSTLSLAQAVSGSGTRYEGSGAVFVGKGNNGMLTQNGKTTYSNCLAGTETAAGTGLTTFIDGTNSFGFTFPSTFALSGGEIGFTQSWSNNATTTGLVLAMVTIPRSYMPKTNFSEAKFTVGASSDPSAIAMCTTAVNGEKSGGTVNIHGVSFTKLTASDAAAGNLYDTTSYRALIAGDCFSVEYTIHSTQLANYDPSQGITQYDKAKIQNALESIAQSFQLNTQS